MVKVLMSDNFDDLVLNSDKPVMVDFYADWCGPCKAAEPIVEELAEDYEGQLLVAKVNVDDQAELAKRFDVMSIPTVVIFQNSEEVDRKIGFGGKKGYEDLIKKVINKQPDVPSKPTTSRAKY